MTKISLSNVEQVNALLNAAQGKSTARTLGADSLQDVAASVEKGLDQLGVPESSRRQITVWVSGGSKLPGAYGHRAFMTEATIIRTPSGWYLTHADRVDNRPVAGGYNAHLPYSDSQVATWAVRTALTRGSRQ